MQVQEGSSTHTPVHPHTSASATLGCCTPGFVQPERQKKCGKEKTRKDLEREMVGPGAQTKNFGVSWVIHHFSPNYLSPQFNP